MSIVPFDISPGAKVLVVGAGGGCDFLCGLPVILELESGGHEVVIANYSFTDLYSVENSRRHDNSLVEITADCVLKSGDYFPEVHLAKWYRTRNREKSIWCFPRLGIKPLLEAYNWIIEKFSIKTVICVDGGVDGIFRGDEHELGTPSMDSISVIAASRCAAAQKVYVCTAFGTEGSEGKLSHAQVLNRMADLIRTGAMLGVSTIRNNDDIGRTFIEAIDFIFGQTSPVKRSIILSTIMAALQGRYGRRSVHPKTEAKPPWISPLTLLLWFFEAEQVAEMKLFYDEVLETSTVMEVAEAIENKRQEISVRGYESIPI